MNEVAAGRGVSEKRFLKDLGIHANAIWRLRNKLGLHPETASKLEAALAPKRKGRG